MLNALTALSLLLLIGSVVLWAQRDTRVPFMCRTNCIPLGRNGDFTREYRSNVWLSYTEEGHLLFDYARGRYEFYRDQYAWPRGVVWYYGWWPPNLNMHFVAVRDDGKKIELEIPQHRLVMYLLLVPGIWLVTRLVSRWLRARRGMADCVACGYNLTGNVSGVCPECGREIVHLKSEI